MCSQPVSSVPEYVLHLFSEHYKQQMIDILGPHYKTDAANGTCPLCQSPINDEETWVRHMSIDHGRLMQHIEEDISHHVQSAFSEPLAEEEEDEDIVFEGNANSVRLENAETDNDEAAAGAVLDEDESNDQAEAEDNWQRCDNCGVEGFPSLEVFKSHKCELDEH